MIPRIVSIGQRVEASASFSDENGKAVKPRDTTIYPVYRIINHNGEFVSGGIGTLDTKSQMYLATFTMPDYAEISADDGGLTQSTDNQGKRPYMIEWEMIDINGKQWNYRETFEVGNPLLNSELKEQRHITLPMTSLTLTIPVVRDLSQDMLIFELYSETNEDKVLWSSIPNPAGSYGEYYLYSITIPPNVMVKGKDYIGVWKFSDSPLQITNNNYNNATYGNSITSTTYQDTTSGFPTNSNVRTSDITVFTQVITCVSMWELKMCNGMRMYLDKVCKNIDLYTGYRDSDLLFHLHRGSEIINGIGLLTSWKLQDWQYSTLLQGGEYWLLIAACYSCLKSQFLAEVDSSFDFSGQPVSLSVNRQGDLDSFASSLWDTLTNQFMQMKNQIVKSNKGMGHLNLTWPTVSATWGFINRRSLGFPLGLPFYSHF